MKYTIKEYEKAIKSLKNDSQSYDSSPNPDDVEKMADLLAEVKQLRETYKRLDGHECLYWRSQHAEVEARLADAVEVLKNLMENHSLDCEGLYEKINACLARISGGQK